MQRTLTRDIIEVAGAAEALDYERAARLRDRLSSVRRAIEKQQMVFANNEDADVIGIADDEARILRAAALDGVLSTATDDVDGWIEQRVARRAQSLLRIALQAAAEQAVELARALS